MAFKVFFFFCYLVVTVAVTDISIFTFFFFSSECLSEQFVPKDDDEDSEGKLHSA